MPSLALIIATAVGLAAVMAGAWLIQRATRNVGWVDVVWTFGTGIAGVVLALAPLGTVPGPRQIAIAVLVALWSLRLGLYIARRVARSPEDGRYVELRVEWGARFQGRMFGFLEAQALAAVLLTLTISLAAHNPAPSLRLLDLAGAAVLIAAILGEHTADQQLRRFRADPANRGRVCDVGLWAWSRHPNYFFEWLFWVAYPLFAIGVGGYPEGWLALAGPAFMYGLLVYVSGVPPLEQHMLRSRGAAYRAYQQRTNAFWPAPPRPAETTPAAR